MELFILAALAGVGVGILSGLLGVGGGTIMVPLFRLAFGLEPIMATATSLFTIIPTSLSGMAKHARNRTSIPRIGLICGLAGACFSPVGVWLATKSPNWLIMTAAALVILYSAFTMFRKALRPEGKGLQDEQQSKTCEGVGGGVPRAVPHEPNAPVERLSEHRTCLSMGYPLPPRPAEVLQLIAIGAFAGLCGGYVGVGGGFIMVPLFVSLLGIPMKKASGTSLMAVCILAVPGVVEQAVLGNVNFTVGLAMAAGTIPGAMAGAGLVKRVPERSLRLLFACFLVVMAFVLVLTELGLLS